MFGESWRGYLRFLRLAFFLIFLITVGRLVLSATGVPYEKGTGVFSIIITIYYLSFLYGAFARKLKGYRPLQSMMLGAITGFGAELIILLLTLASFGFNTESYFNHPTALNLEAAASLGEAIPIRLLGVAAGTIMCGVLGLLGWLSGALLPETGSGKSA